MTIRAPREPDLSAKHQGFPYQAQALAATKDLPYAAIFHEQGLGKTKIGIDLALYWISTGVIDSVLIVTKRGLIQNWIEELRSHTYVEPRVISQDRRANFLAFNSPARIYLAHYEVMKSEQARLDLFLKTRKVAIVLDEAHKIKNPESTIAQALFKLSLGFARRVIMTGTPVANRPYDLWAQIFFLDQGAALGTDFDEFRKTLDLTNDMYDDSIKTDLFEGALTSVFEKIRPFSIRETKQGADIQLPQKHISIVKVGLESRQEDLYDRYKKEFASILVKLGQPVLDEAEDTLKRLLRLIQVASNPRLIDDSYHGVPGKFPVLSDLVSDIVSRDEKVIIWTTFTQNVDWLAKEFKSYNAVRIHGRLAHEQRERSVRLFKTDPDCKVLVATPSSAKEGLTLTSANNAIFYDRSFSLDDYLQAQDRIHRISQKKDCSVINLIAESTIDEWVEKLLSAKHLAAQLAQGDINRAHYHKSADYSFGDMIKDILGIRRDEHEAKG
ncbi:DEAD/DEAH box helicase [Edaphobacter sp. DSM 109919]|uniref:DEAD/DEAH box helicase n=1 Tax=Edaphobacter paludis TaxID=3035702 RepID=A0AAU7CU21_9BACT